MIEGKLNAENWIDKSEVFNLEDINSAIEAVAQRRHIKPLIKIKRD